MHIGAIAARQDDVALVELGDIDLQARLATRKESRIEFDLFGTLGADGLSAADQQQAMQGPLEAMTCFYAGWRVETHVQHSRKTGVGRLSA